MGAACSAPLHIQHSVRAADRYHSAYITDDSGSSRASRYSRLRLVLTSGCVQMCSGKEN